MDQGLIEDIIQWDIYNWSKALPFWESSIDIKRHKKVLALGEREGGLSLWLSLKGLYVTCTDYKSFESTPLKLHVKHKVTHQINYAQADATKLDFEANSFDIVIFKSMVGALGTPNKQQLAFDEAYRVLKPGGILIYAENLKATKVHQWARNRFTSWGERWYYPSIKELIGYSKNFESFQYKTIGFLSPFGRSEKQRKALSKFDHFFAPIIPKSWKYILISIARK